MFERLRILDWRQFRRVDVTFDPRLTIFTGANGSGKTTLLNLLGRHFGWDVPFVRHPFKTKRQQVREFLEDHWDTESQQREDQPPPEGSVGWVRYVDGGKAYFLEPKGDQVQFSLTIQNSRPIHGIHIASHRPVPGRAKIEQISTNPPTKAAAAENYRQEVLRRYLGTRSAKTPGQVLKENLMALCLMANAGARVERREDAAYTLNEYESILKKILPKDLGFLEFHVDLPELYLATAIGPVPFDAISGGIASLIDISYQIFMYSPPGEEYVAIIDEPENHLHPAMQRRILSDLVDAFPGVQFVVATHNPFIISSAARSRVYALVHDDGEVVSRYLDLPTKSGSSSEVLRDVLGMQSTLPIWVEQIMSETVDRYVRRGLSVESMGALKQELVNRGLDNVVVEALTEFGRKSGDRH